MGVFLTADWRHLAMLNYEIDPAVLLPLVPRGTELDAWQGRTFVSLVGFMFLDTRVRGLAIPMHRNFEEINLRFYVRRQAPPEAEDRGAWRRGVVFVKEIVPKHAIALTARYLYNENYVALPTSHELRLSAPSGSAGEALGFSPGFPPALDNVESVKYGWRFRGQEHFIEVTTRGPVCELIDGTEEEFIAQHYWGYTRQRDGGTVEYRVEHPAWRRIWQCSDARFQGDAGLLYGHQFAELLQQPPSSAFLAEGSPVSVHSGIRIA